jgi:anticodon-binding protein
MKHVPEGQGGAPETLVRFVELYADETSDPKAILRELKAVGGDLRALRVALTGRARGPALAEVIASIPRDEALRRVHAAL